MDKPQYTKLSALVDKQFIVDKAYGYTWKKYDPESKRMLISDKWEEGYRKVYTLETSEGKLDVGSGQLASLLEAVYDKGKADIVNRTFNVKSNGKTGMDIRYYFNAVKTEQKDEVYPVDDTIDPSEIPF